MHATIHFARSPFAPLALSFFGLALGYLIVGGQKLFRYPPSSRATQRTLGMWAMYGPGIVQLTSAVLLWVGLTWFGVFVQKPAAYVLAVAFLAQGAHWVAMGAVRLRGADTDGEAWWSIPLLALMVLVAWIEFAHGDVPIAIAFVLLGLVYASDAAHGFHLYPAAERVQGGVQLAAGCWMLYLCYAIALTFTGTLHAWM